MIEHIEKEDRVEEPEITNETSAGFELPNANQQNQQQEMSSSDLMVAFSGRSQNFCVGIVHMCESDIITSTLHRTQMIKYYEIFLNSMSRVLSKHNASILKNAGDSLYYYFPSTVRADKQFGFMSCVECGIELLEIRDEINMYLAKNNLSPLNYRVSTDYGPVVMMKSNTSFTLDMIGSPVSICSKIVQKGPDNEFIVGNELQKIVKVFNDYSFEEMKGYDLPIGYDYKTYSVSRRA